MTTSTSRRLLAMAGSPDGTSVVTSDFTIKFVPQAARSPSPQAAQSARTVESHATAMARPLPRRPQPQVLVRLADPPLRIERSDPRAEAFERLVRLEKDHEAGRVSDQVHATTREALIEELAAFDAARPAPCAGDAPADVR